MLKSQAGSFKVKKTFAKIFNSALLIQKHWRGHLSREKYQLMKSKSFLLQLRRFKIISNRLFHISISKNSTNYTCKLYEIYIKKEFTLKLPAYSHYSFQYIFEHIDYSPLKLFYINEKAQENDQWEIVTRSMRTFDMFLYILYFYRKLHSNKLKIKYFRVGTEFENTETIECDRDISKKSMFEIRNIINSDVLHRLTIWKDTLQLPNLIDLHLFNEKIVVSLRKIQRFVGFM